MALLRLATVEQAAAKVGIFGPQGSGKTTTAALILIGLSKTYHNSAPVTFLDTENGSDYLVPIFEAEKVPLLVHKSRSFQDMKTVLRESEEAGACGYLVDSYTHTWQELNDALKTKLRVNRLEFKHMDQLKGLWRVWTDLMLNSPLHVFLNGRLGYVWDREEDENGKKGDLVKLGTKMKSEADAGYEPSLLVEMEGVQSADARLKGTRRKKSTITHHAYVLKDRWRTLNGQVLTFADLNSYKAGDYKRVFEKFQPHFKQLAIGKVDQRAVDGNRTSAAMFDGAGQSDYAQRQRQKQVALEEIEGTIVALWPGQDAKTKELKRIAIETLFSTRSWTAVESRSVESLEASLNVLRAFESEVRDGRGGDALTDPTSCAAMLTLTRDRLVEEALAASEAAVL